MYRSRVSRGRGGAETRGAGSGGGAWPMSTGNGPDAPTLLNVSVNNGLLIVVL